MLILNYFSGDCMFFWSLLIHQPLSWCGKQFWVETSWGRVNNCNISGWTFPSRLMCLSCSFIYIDLNRDHRVGAADYTGFCFGQRVLEGVWLFLDQSPGSSWKMKRCLNNLFWCVFVSVCTCIMPWAMGHSSSVSAHLHVCVCVCVCVHVCEYHMVQLGLFGTSIEWK